MRGLTKEYVFRRVLMFFLTIWIGATIIFIIPRLAPGDPISAMISRLSASAGRVENADQVIAAWKERFGLNEPVTVQYIKYLGNMLTLNLGYSLAYFPSTVGEMIGRGLPWTTTLLFFATIISFLFGNTIGALMGWRATPKVVKNILPLFLTFTAVPYFMLAILLIFVFAFGLHWFPIMGGSGRDVTEGLNFEFIKDAATHAVLPALSIVIASMGFWALGMRGMMITTDGEDYLILAKAKGLSKVRLFWAYAVRNAILPQVTALALSLGGIVGGSVLVEYLFAYPGVGYLLYQGISSQDYTVVQGVCFLLISSTALAVLIIDLIYPLVDPRITYEKK